MDFSRLRPSDAVGVLASLLLVASVLLLPWFSLGENPHRDTTGAWLCGAGETSCTAFETFPLLRWLLLAGASAPVILAWIVIRGHSLAWAPGELTMVVGFTASVLIAYNGLLDTPGKGVEEIGVGTTYGYWLGLLAAIAISVAGFWRSVEARGPVQRKAPGTV